jgi:hypothetical protein
MELRSVNERMPEAAEAAWRSLEDLAAGGMKPTVSEVFDIEDAPSRWNVSPTGRRWARSSLRPRSAVRLLPLPEEPRGRVAERA